MKAAIDHLEIYLDTLVNNEPVNRAAGNSGQANLEYRSASEVQQALLLLRAAIHGPISKPQ